MVRITYGINNISVVQDSPDEKVDFELIPLPDSVHPKIVVRLSTVVPFQQQLTHLSEVEETAPSATKVCQQQIVPGSTAIELADPAPSDAVPEEKRIVPHGNMPNNLSGGEGQAADKAMKINEADEADKANKNIELAISRCDMLLKQMQTSMAAVERSLTDSNRLTMDEDMEWSSRESGNVEQQSEETFHVPLLRNMEKAEMNHIWKRGFVRHGELRQHSPDTDFRTPTKVNEAAKAPLATEEKEDEVDAVSAVNVEKEASTENESPELSFSETSSVDVALEGYRDLSWSENEVLRPDSSSDPSASEHDEPMQMETQEYFTPRASPAKSIDTPDLNGSSEHTFCMAVSNESSQLELVGEKKDVSLSESDASTTDGPESELKTDNLNNKCEGKNGMMTTNESNDNNSSINSVTKRSTEWSSGQSPQLKIHRSVMSPGSQESFSPVLCSTRVIETKSEESIECTRGGVVASLSSSSSSTISTTTTTRTVSINLPPSPSLIQRQAKKDPKVAVDSILRQLNGSVNRHSIHTRLDELYAVLLTEIEDEKQTSIVNSLSTLRFPLRRMVRILGGTSAFDPMEVKKLLTRIRAAF